MIAPLPLILLAAAAAQSDDILVPVIEEPWLQVAGNPDLGNYTTPHQQPVDFSVWQAADGTWQLWSCIRGTNCGGMTRLFHRWQGGNLKSPDWKPMGVAMESDPAFGETPGGLQAPHVVTWKGRYWMAYGDWVRICFADSDDGKTFRRHVGPSGKSGLFGEGNAWNSRDAMLLFSKGLWYCYYTAFPRGQGYDYCRTSTDLQSWSDSCVAAYGGWAGNGPFSCECPHVVEPEPGAYYLFRTQRYGQDAQTCVYRSANPLNFGIDDDGPFVCALPVAAPEIIRHQGEYYIASLMPDLKGIRIARLTWRRAQATGTPVFDFLDEETRKGWRRLVKGDLDPCFVSSTNPDLAPPMSHFVSTVIGTDGSIHYERTGTIESPPFLVKDRLYSLWVSGTANVQATYVALLNAESGEELARVTGYGGHLFKRMIVDTSRFQGKRAFLRVVDADTGGGYINFGGLFSLPGA